MSSIGRDIASIRKQLNYTIEDIQSITKIPLHVLEAIENDTIFTDLEENTTYIRSYIRSYARALKIDDETIIQALDQVEIGTYDGLLVKEEQEEDDATRTRFQYDDDGEEEDDTEEQDLGTSEESEPPPTPPPTEKSGVSSSQPEEFTPPSVQSVDWADMGKRFIPLKTKSRIWVGLAILFIAIAVGLFFLFTGSEDASVTAEENEENTEENASSPELVPDSLQVNLNDSPTESDDSPEMSEGESLDALPDTLHLVIYAAFNRLEPVRINSDVIEQTTPYWIEEGDAMRFEFVDEMEISGQFSNMVLMLNGHVIEDFQEEFYDSDSQTLEINREFFEEDDHWLEPGDTLSDEDFPPPENILDRTRSD